MVAVLSPLDRATLVVWRVLNVIGWTALAAFVSLNLHWIAVQFWGSPQIAGYHRGGPGWDLGVGATARILAYRVVLAVGLSWVTSALVARRVWTRPTLYASVAAVAYVAWILVTFEHSQGTGARIMFGLGADERAIPNSLMRMSLHDLAIASAIPMTWFSARREALRRPSV